ncbi:MAG: hypothetical protein AAFR47_00575 [Pseudomonadota bacterium]
MVAGGSRVAVREAQVDQIKSLFERNAARVLADGRGCCCEAGFDNRREEDDIRAVAPDQQIGPRARFEPVIAAASAQRVVAEPAIEPIPTIVAGRVVVAVPAADDVLNAGEGLYHTQRNRGPGRDIDRHKVQRQAEIQQVAATTAIDFVRASAALERVVALAPTEPVRTGAPVDQIVATLAMQLVIFVPPKDLVGSAPAEQTVGVRCPRKDVVPTPASRILEPIDNLELRGAVTQCQARGEVDLPGRPAGHPHRGCPLD